MFNIKKLKQKVAGVLCLATVLTTQLNPATVKAVTSQGYWFSTKAVEVVAWDSVNQKNVWYSMAKLGDQTAYCIDYTCPLPSGYMAYRDTMKDAGLSVLLHGYPNNTPSQMGLDSAEEAYMATQMALWEVMNRTGESQNAGRTFRVSNITPASGKQAFWNKVVPVAQQLVSIAESNPFTSTPTMTVGTDSAHMNVSADKTKVTFGPYVVNVSGLYSPSYLKSITAALENAPASAYFSDANGNARSASMANGEPIYVTMSTEEASKNINIKFHANLDRKVGVIYRDTDNRNVQDYVMIDTENIDVYADVPINWKRETAAGDLVIVKNDQFGEPVAGVTFAVLREDGSELLRATTKSSGKITILNLPVGNYQVVEISAPKGYVVQEQSKNITIAKDQKTEITITNERIQGKIKVHKIDDNDRPVEGVIFELVQRIDGKYYSVGTMTTDADGYASIEAEYGEYFVREIYAPEGYIINEDYVKAVVNEERRTNYMEITNETLKGAIVVTKIDQDGEPIANVKFNLYTEKGVYIDYMITNDAGKCGYGGLPYGKYYYQEVSVPDGYILDSEMHEFTINSTEYLYVTVTNEKVTGTFKVTKVDDLGNPVPKVVIAVLDSSKNEVARVTTDSNGKAEVGKLPLGTYYYKEISVPAGYVMDTTEHQFVFDINHVVVEKEIENHLEKGKLHITKYDNKNRTLANITFEILDVDGNSVGMITTDENGEAESDYLPLGDYFYKEISTPDKYVQDGELHPFYLKTDNQVSKKAVFNKIIEGKLKIIKVDENNEPLEGVKFNILDKDKNVIETIVTDAQGVAESGELEKETYYYKEIEAPEGIIIDSTEYEFTIETDGQNVIKNMVNYYSKGKLQITKYDSKNRALSGVVFKIFDSNGKEVDTLTTDAQGKAESKNLPLGTYTYQEISAPNNVVVDNAKYSFKLETNNQVVSKEVTNKVIEGKLKIIKVDENNKPLAGVKFEIYDSSKTLVDTMVTNDQGIAESKELEKGSYFYKEVEAPNGIRVDDIMYPFTIETDGQNVIENMVNYLEKGGLKIIKVDENSKPLAGVKFEIYDADKNKIDTMTTNDQGVAQSTVELTLGNYFYKEVSAPAGIKVDSTMYPFTVETDGQNVVKNMTNFYEKGTLTIIKVDENSKPLAGVKFEIYDADKNKIDTIVTDAEGKATSNIEMNLGSYFYKEIEAPAGIRVDSTMYPFTVEYDGQNVIKNMTNYYSKGGLKIIKVDENSKPLAGVKFEIYDADKNKIDTIETNKDGVAVSNVELTLGSYFYKEIAAPEGIRVDNTMYSFKVEYDGQNVIRNMTNNFEKGTLEIIKVDENEKPLAGVKFEIYDSNKKKVTEMTTDEEGIARANGLVKGITYYYKEVAAPEGIVIDSTMYEFVITYDGENVIKHMVNNFAKGKIEITKLVEGTDKPLAGVTFEILDSTKENVVDTIVTNENGVAESKNLVVGTYYFKEVKAPEGYVMDETVYEFKLEKDNDLIKAVVYNAAEEVPDMPETGALVGTNMLIILLVTMFSLAGYSCFEMLRVKKEN